MASGDTAVDTMEVISECCLVHVTNLASGISKSKLTDKKQVEHHFCLGEIFREFKDLCKVGGFKTIIYGQKVVLEFFIWYIAGHNNLTLHLRINSGCHC